MALRATRLGAWVRGPKRAAHRSRLHHPRFACSVRARRNQGSISITHGGICNPRWKPNCNRRGSHRWPGWEGVCHGNHIVPRAEDGAMKGTCREAELVVGLSGFRSASVSLPTTGPTMPFADFCPAVRMPLDILSHRSDTGQLSWGKLNRLPCIIAGSTLCIFDGSGLRSTLPVCPTLTPHIRFLSIDSHVCSTLPSDLVCRRMTSLQG